MVLYVALSSGTVIATGPNVPSGLTGTSCSRLDPNESSVHGDVGDVR